MPNKLNYTINIDAEISALKGKLANVQAAFKNLDAGNKTGTINAELKNLTDRINNLQKLSKEPITSEASFGKLNKELASAKNSYNELTATLTTLEEQANSTSKAALKVLPKETQQRIKDAEAAMQKYNAAIDASKEKTKELKEAEKKVADLKAKKIALDEKKARLEAELTAASNTKESHKEALTKLADINKQIDANQKLLDTVTKLHNESTDANKNNQTKYQVPDTGEFFSIEDLDKQRSALEAEQAILQQNADTYRTADKDVKAYNSQLATCARDIREVEGQLTTATKSQKSFNSQWLSGKKIAENTAYSNLRQELEKLGVSMDNISPTRTLASVDELNQRVQNISTEAFAKFNSDLVTSRDGLHELAIETDRTSQAIDENAEEVAKQNKAYEDVSGLTNRIKQFVGVQGAMVLMRRAMRSAMDTIKELDAQMTQMAVVTKQSIGDYWNQLPTYTKRADALGVSIKSAYEAATLYYQQGLKTNEVVAVSNATLKMARIAGLDAEDATNKMTAALRGFNMAVTETNADRVADVYSKLAAITASNVEEISSAMTKTASLASSAGMQFETTAAFLAQIIETTRESAETAGTALKTVIARFQELKKDPAEIGEVDGEVIDANKIETALRTVGVSLRDARGQFRDLDEVFLELSSKWDTLDKNTQRYIATIAAGSRQQSRFIAMMQDYSRTTELVNAANNAAGASTEQYEKTLESLETKLARLKNAWDTFTMGLMNNQIIKLGIDAITGLIGAVNDLTNAFGNTGSIVAKFALIKVALSSGEKVLSIFLTEFKKSNSIFAGFKAVGSSAINSIQLRLEALHISMKRTLGKPINILPIGQTAKIQASLKSIQKSMQDVAYTESELKKLTEQYSKGMMTAAEYEAQCVAVNQLHDEAMEELNSQLVTNATLTGLSNDELKEAAAIQNIGISTTTACAAASKGYTAAMLDEYFAANGVTEAIEKEKLAKDLANASGLRGVIVKKLYSVATNQTTVAILGQAAANKILEISAWMATVPMLGLVFIMAAIVVAIVSLIATIVLLVMLFKKLSENTPENKLKALKEEANAAAEALDEAKDAYSELMEQIDKYDDANRALNELVEGSIAWKNQIQEINNQVDDLINKYPELIEMGAISIDSETGLKSINENALKQLEKNYSRGVEFRQTDALIKQAKVGRQTQLNNIANEIGDSGIMADYLDKNLDQMLASKDGNFFEKYGQYVKATFDFSAKDGMNAMMWGPIKTWMNKQIGTAASFIDFYNDPEAAQKYADQLRQSQKNYNRQLIYNTAQDDYGSTNALAMSNILENMDLTTISKQSKYDINSKSGLKAAMASYGLKSGVDELSNLKRLYLASTGQEFDDTDLKDREVKSKIKEELSNLGTTIAIQDIEKQLASVVGTSDQLKQLFQFDLDLNTEEAQKQINELGEDIDENVRAGLQSYLDQLTERKSDIALRVNEIFGENALNRVFNSSYNLANKLLTILESEASDISIKASLQAISDSLSYSNIEEFTDGLANINFNSAVDGAADFKKILEGDNDELKRFATTYLELESNSYSLTAQAAEVFNSLSSDTLQELMSDAKVTAAEVKELANSSSKLKTMMDTTGISTNTLATYFEKLGNGLLNAISQTNNFVTVLDKLQKAQNTISDMFETVENFATGTSITSVRDFLSDAKDSFENLYALGAYNDQAIIDYEKLILGDQGYQDALDTFGGDLKQVADRVNQILSSTGENFYGLWTQFANSSNLASIGESGEIQFAIDRLTTLEDLISNITQTLGVSRQIATMMVGDAQIYSADTGSLFNSMSAMDGLKDWLNSGISFNGKTIYDEDELNLIAQSFGVEPEELMDQLSKYLGKKLDVKKIFENGTLSSDIFEELKGQLSAQIKRNDGQMDFTNIYQKLLGLGLDDQKAREQISLLFKDVATQFTATDKFILDNTGLKLEYGEYENNLSAVTQDAIVTGITEGYEDKETKLAQKKNAIEAARGTAQAMGAAIVSALSIINGQEIGLDKIDTLYTKIDSIVDKQLENTEQETKNIERLEKIGQGTNGTVLSNISEELLRRKLSGDIAASSSYNASDAQLIEDGDKDSKWENPYTWLYNMNEAINGQIRERSKMEREYQKLLQSEELTAQKIFDNQSAQLDNLKEQSYLQAQKSNNAMREATTLMKQAPSDFSNYVGIKDGKIFIDYEGLDNDKSKWTEDQGQVFEDFVGRFEELRDIMQDSEDALNDIEDEVKEIGETGKEQYDSLLSDVREAMTQAAQKQIDVLSALNESVSEANSKLLDKMQEQVDISRQTRDNAKTEQNLTNKQARLAYLMRDSSGSNAAEILSLQKEIANDQESYQDTLIDQTLSQLQSDNEKAAEQRQEQIDIAQAQLDYWSEYDSWKDAEKVLNKDLVSDVPFSDTISGKLLGEYKNIGSMTKAQLEEWSNNLNQESSLAKVFNNGTLMNKADSILTHIKGKQNSVAEDIAVELGNSDLIGQGIEATKQHLETLAGKIQAAWDEANSAVKVSNAQSDSSGDGKISSLSQLSYGDLTVLNVDETTNAVRLGKAGARLEEIKEQLTDELYQELSQELLDIEHRKKNSLQFATGGLADFTGPAWMDGTSTHPELVLNAQDTENFLTLKNVLGEIMKGNSIANSDGAGNNYYDVQISVDKLESDYDVEALVSKIKSMITDDAMYRNVNAVSLIR